MVKTLLVKGIFETNCYLFIDDETNHGFLIDPGADASKIRKVIDENGYKIEKILITHGHFDHIGAADRLSQYLGVPIYMHEEGRRYANDPMWNLSKSCGLDIVLYDVNYIKEEKNIVLEANTDVNFEIINIPGHTPDGIMYYNEKEKIAFVGDTIFAGSIGTTQYFGGDSIQLASSILDKILELPEDTILYSGHSRPTTVGIEKKRIYSQITNSL